jgi:hypothetical protein
MDDYRPANLSTVFHPHVIKNHAVFEEQVFTIEGVSPPMNRGGTHSDNHIQVVIKLNKFFT